ncbi:hypothetical protein EV122DRAFT_280438 [Schizophyllum commune]
MKCISTTCQKVITFFGFHASNCPHVFCQACYLELVMQTKIKGQVVHCPECSTELVLHGTLDMAIVHLHPEKGHGVAADLGYDELVDRWHHLDTLDTFLHELRCAGREEDRATTELRASITAGQLELKHLEAMEAALSAKAEALKRDLATIQNSRIVVRILGMLLYLWLVFVMLVLGLIVVPQSLGFSIYRVLKRSAGMIV